MGRVKNGTLYLIPASAQTSGHLTTGNAKFYVEQLREFCKRRHIAGCSFARRFGRVPVKSFIAERT